LSIIVDEKQYSTKLYLSLLKSQIFDNNITKYPNLENGEKIYSKKKRKINEKNENIYDNDNKIVHEDKNIEVENIKPSYTKLLNYNIEDKECAGSFFNQKRVPKSPYKVLDAPNLKDDFYLHLVDWSKSNLLAVALENTIYTWEGNTCNVNSLYTCEGSDMPSAVHWLDNEKLLIGMVSGEIHLWDINKSMFIQQHHDHNERVGVFARMNTRPDCFSSGSQDKSIINYDTRCSNECFKFLNHTQEVCGLKWSLDDTRLASGGNDNKLNLWNLNKRQLEKKLLSHKSAIKAIDWSPHKFGYLLSGGGTQDRTIKVWNTNTMKLVESIDTGSQVCNIAFSKESNEFVSTHGYSHNLILLWDSEKLNVKAAIKGHKDRVIYLSVGPDNRKIVTGAGDDTLKFWDIFIKDDEKKEISKLNNFKFR
jgi:cell division cycle 20-like protein 1 (cofactor of APC complex)